MRGCDRLERAARPTARQSRRLRARPRHWRRVHVRFLPPFLLFTLRSHHYFPSPLLPTHSFALQFAVASGATVIATSSSSAKLAKAKALGATHLINYTETPDWDQEVLKLTNGEGVHHVIEVGGPATAEKSLNCLRMGGYVHVIGFLGGMVRGPRGSLGDNGS